MALDRIPFVSARVCVIHYSYFDVAVHQSVSGYNCVLGTTLTVSGAFVYGRLNPRNCSEQSFLGAHV
jgi:hypothetical protein